MPRCFPFLTSFVRRFLRDFCSQLGPPKPQKSKKFHWFYFSFLFFSLFKIRSIFDPILVPTLLHFPSPNPPKSYQTSILKGIDCLLDFRIVFFHAGSILGPKLGPCWPHFCSKGGSRVKSCRLFCWVYVIFRFFGPPGPFLAPFGLDFGRFGAPFWRFWASIFPYFCKIWGVLC